MEVVAPTVNGFYFSTASSSPYVSAPSSPKRFEDSFDYYYRYASAPTSPSSVAAVFASSAVPFGWEEKPGIPRLPKPDDADDFAFDFSGRLEKGGQPPDLSTADQLFEKGKIRALKPPPGLCNLSVDERAGAASLSPRSPKLSSKGFWSPGEGFDPFTAAMVEATRERGREKAPSSSLASISSSQSRKGTRSLSSIGGGFEGFFPKSSKSSAAECLKNTSGGSRKWRLRDFLLFRSASEGRVTGNRGKDSRNSNSLASLFSASHKGGEDSRNSSFRSTDSGGSMRRGSGPIISAHEIHYMSNRAASEERKKKTALPFNLQGLFGCLRFNPAVSSIARGFHNSYSFSRRQS